MPVINQPDTTTSAIADLDRRVRLMETSPRVGLSRLISSKADGGGPMSTIGTWVSAPDGPESWFDTAGRTGSGYPEVTSLTGKRALFLISAEVDSLSGRVTTARCYAASVGIGISGTNPDAWLDPTLTQPAPVINAQLEQNNTALDVANLNLSFSFVRTDLTPGVNVFKMWLRTQSLSAGSVVYPSLWNPSLTVIPID